MTAGPFTSHCFGETHTVRSPDFFVTFSFWGAISVAPSLFIVCTSNPNQTNSKRRSTKKLRQKANSHLRGADESPSMCAVPPHLFFISVPLYLPFSVPATTRPPRPHMPLNHFVLLQSKLPLSSALCLFICARGSRIPDCSRLCTRELFSFVLMSPCLTPLLLLIVRGFIIPLLPDETKPNLSFIRKRSVSQGLKAQDGTLPCNLERQMKCFMNLWDLWASPPSGRKPKESDCKGKGLPKKLKVYCTNLLSLTLRTGQSDSFIAT